MPLPHYTAAAIRAARLAGKRAARAGAKRVEPEHLLLALLTRQGILTLVLANLQMDPAPVLAEARRIAGLGASAPRSNPRLSGRMEKILFDAETQATSLGNATIDTQHLLLALVNENGPAAHLLIEQGLDYETIRRTVRQALYIRPPAYCPACGYDLRATPIRCPECGRVV